MTTATMSDVELQRAVLEELRWEPGVNAAHIGVAVKDGVVTLTGHVPSYAERYWAEKAAKRVHGVRAVANELDVKLPGSSKRTDEDIAAAAVNALRSNLSVPADKIKVIVSSGWVTLEGEVEWQYQRDAAERAVRYLPGVTGVSNLITVRFRVPPPEFRAKIEDALKRSATPDARHVEARGGRLRSWVERLRRVFGMAAEPPSPHEEYDPIYGLPRRAVEEWLARNPQLSEEHDAALLQREVELRVGDR
jgi:osmotically-inducible protein OsmY